jgi:hypothetical protein
VADKNVCPTIGGRVKLLDFGLVRPVDDDVHLTPSGAVAGTPAYMAPEQARGQEVDARCDLFSLGCVLYHTATGQLPFQGDDPMSLVLALATQQPAPPRQLNPDVPAGLNDLILRLLAKDPAARPASARAVADELAALAAAAPAARWERRRGAGAAAPRRRGRPVPLAAAGVLLAGLAGLARWYGPTVIRVATNKGELVVEVEDPDVEVAGRGEDPGRLEPALGAGRARLGPDPLAAPPVRCRLDARPAPGSRAAAPAPRRGGETNRP